MEQNQEVGDIFESYVNKQAQRDQNGLKFKDIYTFKKVLGKGSFAIVLSVVSLTDNNKYAIKVIN